MGRSGKLKRFNMDLGLILISYVQTSRSPILRTICLQYTLSVAESGALMTYKLNGSRSLVICLMCPLPGFFISVLRGSSGARPAGVSGLTRRFKKPIL